MNTQSAAVRARRNYRSLTQTTGVAKRGVSTKWQHGLQMFVGNPVLITAVDGVSFVGSLVFADQFGLTLDETGYGNETEYIYIPLTQISFIAYQQ